MFKTGDKVEYLGDDEYTYVSKGEIYTIKECFKVKNQLFITLREVQKVHSYCAKSFKLVEEEKRNESNDKIEEFKNITSEMLDTYIKKNTDYGNSFSEQFSEYGMISSCIRLEDKMRRLKRLTKSESMVKDESIEDTLLDMSNYAIMTVIELRKQKLTQHTED